MTATYAPTAGLPTRGRRASLEANARGVYIIWSRELMRYRRDRARLISSLGQPLLFLIVFGSGLTASLGGGLKDQLGDVSYVRFLVPGIIAMAVRSTVTGSPLRPCNDIPFGVT
jgi:ABC-2 type transport system permease protein